MGKSRATLVPNIIYEINFKTSSSQAYRMITDLKKKIEHPYKRQTINETHYGKVKCNINLLLHPPLCMFFYAYIISINYLLDFNCCCFLMAEPFPINFMQTLPY